MQREAGENRFLVGKLEAENAKDAIALSPEYLQIKAGSRNQAWAWQDVQRLSLQTRKLWLPLIGGTILATLCLIALFTTYKYPWWLMTGSVVGSLLAYYGWQPRPTLVVQENKHHTDFLLSKPAGSLPIYIALANRLAIRYPQDMGRLFLPLERSALQILAQGSSLRITGWQRLYWPEDVRNMGLGIWLDPWDAAVKFSFEINNNGRLIAYCTEEIRADSVAEFSWH
jgi:hypothetical protein